MFRKYSFVLIRMRTFEVFPDLEIVVTDATDGNMAVSWGPREVVLPRRERFFDQIGWNKEKTILLHLHGAEYDIVEAKREQANFLDPDRHFEHQGAMTDDPELVLSLLVADCAPVALYDPYRRVHALIHAGFRETDKDMPGTAVRAMQDTYGSPPENLKVWIGPAIRSCCYRFTRLPQDADPHWMNYLRKANEGYEVDLVGMIRDKLVRAGVRQHNMMDVQLCTSGTPALYSHFRDSRAGVHEGRFLVAVRQGKKARHRADSSIESVRVIDVPKVVA